MWQQHTIGGIKMKKKMNVQTLVVLGVLTAMEIILSRFLSIAAWNVKIGFSFVPIVIAAVVYGPAGGAIVGGLGDLVGALLFPIGAYFPGFTLTAILTGAVFGLFLHKRQTLGRLLGAILINLFILSLFLNTLWISLLYGSAYGPLLATRVIQCLILAPVQFVVTGSITKVIKLYTARKVEV